VRGPDYALEKAHNRYRSVWRDALLGTDSGAYTVALDPPSATDVTTRAGDDFTTLLAATAWFRAHPRSGLTVRSVPVPGMHTKWLARHRGMVLACLGTPTDSTQPTEPAGESDPADIPTGDLDALGLRPLPREVSIVLSDPVLCTVAGGLRQISAPVDELARLPICPDTVLIVENKEPALAWSDTAGLVVIHSLGNHLDVLGSLPWIPHDRCCRSTGRWNGLLRLLAAGSRHWDNGRNGLVPPCLTRRLLRCGD
jgi:uncharacterized protein DUF3322/Wadjet anti plasmid transformation system JetA-like protein